jgi:hypothetical protein
MVEEEPERATLRSSTPRPSGGRTKALVAEGVRQLNFREA